MLAQIDSTSVKHAEAVRRRPVAVQPKLEKIGSPMTKLMLTAITLGFIGAHMIAPAKAQSANAEEVKICKETISEMTGGKPPAEAVKLCDQGKLNEAIEKAMAGG